MEDLALPVDEVLASFSKDHDAPYVLVRITEDEADEWVAMLTDGARRCYVTDEFLQRRATELGLSQAEILASRLPEPGSVMAGDFGEILTFIYQGACEYPTAVIGPKKWRLKQDRLKPAPYSDVVQLIVPGWPTPSAQDRLLCSEVKTKSTDSDSTPIASAIADCEKDRTTRLAKTLVWLRERALQEDLGTTTIGHLDRFINATDHPQAQREFRAVAVICTSLLDGELETAPEEQSTEYTLLILAVPALKERYESLFGAIRDSVPGQSEPA